MARGNREWTQTKFERYCKEGRGKGSGENYKPWLTVRDVPSKGRSSRIPGWKTNREHHLFSDHETRLFYLFEWSEIITDIREQFPLIDLDLAMSIASEMGVKYPIDRQNGTPYVLTTDFLLTVNQNGKSFQVARTVKPTTDLEKQSVAEKLELERRYYITQGIDWGIVTEKEIPKILAKNVEWIHSAYWLEPTETMNVEALQSLANIFKFRLQESNGIITQVTKDFDTKMNIESGTSLYLFKHLVANREIIIDMGSTLI